MANDVKKIIDKVVRERLSEACITDVLIEEDEGFDGEPIYSVIVIYDDKKGRLDTKQAVGLLRNIRSCLDDDDTLRFPIFRFVSRSDAKSLDTASA